MKNLLTLMLMLLCISTYAQKSITMNKGRIKEKRYNEMIPYQFENGHIFVQVSINNKKYRFLFDTGASLIIVRKICDELQLKNIVDVEVEDSSDKTSSSFLTILPELQLGRITFLKTTSLVIDEENATFKMLNIDGIIGSNMLRNSVLQINHENKTLTLTNNPNNVVAPNTPFQTLEINDDQSSPFVNISFDKNNEIIEKVLFDTGFNGLYDMSIDTYESLKDSTDIIQILSEATGSRASGLWGMADEDKLIKFNLSNLNINNVAIPDIVTTVSSQNTSSKIGSKILEYGSPILDYKNKRFYFEAYKKPIQKEQNSKKQWEISPNYHNDKLVVGVIWNEVLKSTVNIGDEILKINDINFVGLSVKEIMDKMKEFKSEDSLILQLKDVNTGVIKQVEIKAIK